MDFLILRWGLQKQCDEKGRDLPRPFCYGYLTKAKRSGIIEP